MPKRILRVVVEIRDTDLDTIFKDIVDDILLAVYEKVRNEVYRILKKRGLV